jgi:ankyrin repeat protein
MDGGNWKELFSASCEGDIELVRHHVTRGVDVNYAHPEFLSTPLVASILAGQEEVALYLLSAGADPSLHSEFDAVSPVQAAQKVGLVKVQDKLVELGAIVPAPVAPSVRRSWWRSVWERGAA